MSGSTPKHPKQSGVCDTRLGSIGGLPCRTCGHDGITCTGHWGHIELVQPFYHSGFQEAICKILRAVCYFCSELLDQDTDTSTMRPKLALMTHAVRSTATTRCSACGGCQPTYARATNCQITCTFYPGAMFDNAEEKNFAERKFTPRECLSIFKNISGADCVRLGMNPSRSRPEDMIMEVIRVPPISIRPMISVADTSRSRGHDDLTLKLQVFLHFFTLF